MCKELAYFNATLSGQGDGEVPCVEADVFYWLPRKLGGYGGFQEVVRVYYMLSILTYKGSKMFIT